MSLADNSALLLARARAFDEAAEMLAAAATTMTARGAGILYVQAARLCQRAREEHEKREKELAGHRLAGYNAGVGRESIAWLRTTHFPADTEKARKGGLPGPRDSLCRGRGD